jgi:hypothetical protein
MSGSWNAILEITNKSGRVITKKLAVSGAARHYAEHLHLFYPSAVKIAWTPMDAKHANALGPTRSVEFDADGKVTRRTPDHDGAQVGRDDFEEPDDFSWTASGDARAGTNPADDKSIGRHPTESDDDEAEEDVEPTAPKA